MADTGFKAGLEDVVALTSDLCFIDGKEGRLVYRGYDAVDLSEHATFEEVVFLLWYGNLPNAGQLKTFLRELGESRQLDPAVERLLASLPKTTAPMDALRTAVSLAGIYDPDGDAMEPEVNQRKAVRLVAQIPTMVAAFDRMRKDLPVIAPDRDLALADNFLWMLTGKRPSGQNAKAFDTALILHADHELNASTFSARVTAGTLSDIYSATTSAIGTLKGPLHGGANEQVMRMVDEIGSLDNVRPWLDQAFQEKRKIMGFGHRVYKTDDPRAVVLRRFSREMSQTQGTMDIFNRLEAIGDYVREQKHLHPNVDFYSGSVYRMMEIPVDVFTPVFAISRIAGWTAHILEQYHNNRLIRPRAEYTGPTHLTVKPIAER
ncbi:MAG: citrate synthase [Firmicutes bacterium]|nr:citrate synthase [Bacillota bacterium]